MAKIANYNFNCDLSPVVLWQYNDAEKLKGIVANQQEFMKENVQDFFENLRDNVFNLENADEFGLAVWGSLLGVLRPTYEDGGQTVSFTDDQYRLLLRAKIYLLTFDGSAKALNEFFKILFPEMLVQIKDNLDMTVTINVLNEIPEEYRVLFRAPYVDMFIPRPSGVAYTINAVPLDLSKTFTFEGMTDSNNNPGAGFDQGTFYQG